MLLPLAAICAILAVLWPAARKKMGFIGPALALLALILVPLTTSASEALKQVTPPNPRIEKHTELGDQALIWAAPLFVFATLWWICTHRGSETDSRSVASGSGRRRKN